jgi:hypothetical protein
MLLAVADRWCRSRGSVGQLVELLLVELPAPGGRGLRLVGHAGGLDAAGWSGRQTLELHDLQLRRT